MGDSEETDPLRQAIEVSYAEIISPYRVGQYKDPCKACESEARKDKSNSIMLYDIVIGLTDKPYLKITACEPHLKRALGECISGIFEYSEFRGAHVSFYRRAYDNTLIVEDSKGLPRVLLSKPIHHLLEREAETLKEKFMALIDAKK